MPELQEKPKADEPKKRAKEYLLGKSSTAPKPIQKPQEVFPKRPHVADDPLEDAANLANELVVGTWETLKLAGSYSANPKEFIKDWQLTLRGRNLRDTLGAMWGTITDNYEDDEGKAAFGDAVVRRPFHTASDIAAIASIIGAPLKAAARISGGASRLGMTAEMAAKVGKLSAADRLMKAGEMLDKVARNVDPVMLAARGVKKAGGATLVRIKELAGIGEHTDEIQRITANVRASEHAAAAEEKVALANKHLAPEDAEVIGRAIRRGKPEDFAELAGRPAAKEWYEKFNKQVIGEGGQEPYLTAQQVGLTESRKLRANAIAAALEEFGDSSDANVALAQEKIKSGQWKPTYATLSKATEADDSILGTLERQYERSRRYGRLESRAGATAAQEDIFDTAMRQIDAYHHNKSRLRIMGETLQMLASKGKAIPVRNLRELPKGYAVVDDAVLKRYFEVKNRSGAALLEELTKGLPGPDAQRAAYEKLIGDKKLRDPIMQSNGIAVPKHVARWLDIEFAAPTGLGIIYDRFASYWRALATIWRPSAWLGAAIGNGFMDVLHGVGFDDIVRSRKMKGKMPPEVGNVVQGVTGPEGVNAFERVSQSMGEAYSGLDNTIIRGPVWSKETERIRRQMLSINEQLKKVGSDFFVSADVLNDPVKFAELVASGPEVLSKARTDILLLHERIAGSVPEVVKMTSQRARLLAQVRKLEAGLTKLSVSQERRGIRAAVTAKGKTQQLGGDVARMKQRAADIERTLSTLTKDSPQIEELAQREIGKIPPATLEAEVNAKLAQIPGYARTRDAQILRDTIGEVRRRILERKAQELKPKLYETYRKALESEWERITAASEQNIKLGRGLAAEARAPRSLSGKVADAASQSRQEMTRLRVAITKLEDDIRKAKAEAFEAMADAGRIQQRIPELEQLMRWSDEGIEAGNRLGGSYARLHPIERRYFRRVVPFYPYMKAMTLLVFRLPFLYPKRVFFWNHWSRMVHDMMQDEYTPEFLENSIPVGHSADGGTFFIKISSLVPWSGVRTAEIGQVPIPSIADVFSSNPIIKATFEMKGGIPQWTQRPITPGEMMTRLDNGEVWKLERDGKARKTIAQPSFWRSLWYMFPPSQLIESVFMPYKQRDQGWLLNPDPVTDPQGKPMYPHELLERITSFIGTPVRKYDLERTKRVDRIREVKVVQSMMGDIRRMTPEKREAAIQALRDWIEMNRKRRSAS